MARLSSTPRILMDISFNLTLIFGLDLFWFKKTSDLFLHLFVGRLILLIYPYLNNSRLILPVRYGLLKEETCMQVFSREAISHNHKLLRF